MTGSPQEVSLPTSPKFQENGFEIRMTYRQEQVQYSDFFVEVHNMDPNEMVTDPDFLDFSIRDLKGNGAEITLEARRLHDDEIENPDLQQEDKKTILEPENLSPAQRKLLETVQKTMATHPVTDHDLKNELFATDEMPNVFHIHGLARISIHRNTLEMKTPIAQIAFESSPETFLRMQVDEQGSEYYLPFFENTHAKTNPKTNPKTKVDTTKAEGEVAGFPQDSPQASPLKYPSNKIMNLLASTTPKIPSESGFGQDLEDGDLPEIDEAKTFWEVTQSGPNNVYLDLEYLLGPQPAMELALLHAKSVQKYEEESGRDPAGATLRFQNFAASGWESPGGKMVRQNSEKRGVPYENGAVISMRIAPAELPEKLVGMINNAYEKIGMLPLSTDPADIASGAEGRQLYLPFHVSFQDPERNFHQKKLKLSAGYVADSLQGILQDGKHPQLPDRPYMADIPNSVISESPKRRSLAAQAAQERDFGNQSER